LKGHVAIDPEAEVITATTVTAGNTGDAAAAATLLAADLPTTEHIDDDVAGDTELADGGQDVAADALLADLEAAGAKVMTKVQPPVAPGGRFAEDRFVIDTGAGIVTCPAGVVVAIRPAKTGGGTAAFAGACHGCPLVAACTTAKAGRVIRIGAYEAELVRARTTQADPA
jgi:hypothetical protein